MCEEMQWIVHAAWYCVPLSCTHIHIRVTMEDASRELPIGQRERQGLALAWIIDQPP